MSERQNLLNEINYKIKKILFFISGEKFYKKKRYNWSLYPRRYEIIQKIIELKNYNSYLEIGCDKNQSFSNISINKRVGVDPIEGGTHKMTSDKFFINNSDKFDLIFIDGLHEYSQVMRDIKNALKCLAHNGVILLHDCLPRNIWNQITPRINSDWNGDVWKAIVECRTYDHIDTYTCIADQGIGVIIPKVNGNKLTLKNVIFKELKYRDYYYNHEEYMNLIDCKKLYEIIK
jgi:SAM-dependent methyltransferase